MAVAGYNHAIYEVSSKPPVFFLETQFARSYANIRAYLKRMSESSDCAARMRSESGKIMAYAKHKCSSEPDYLQYVISAHFVEGCTKHELEGFRAFVNGHHDHLQMELQSVIDVADPFGKWILVLVCCVPVIVMLFWVVTIAVALSRVIFSIN